MSATTQERLGHLTSLSVDERESLASDLAAEFDAAEENEDIAAMEAAVAGLEKLDLYEQILEELDEESDDDEDADEDADVEDEADEDVTASDEDEAV